MEYLENLLVWLNNDVSNYELESLKTLHRICDDEFFNIMQDLKTQELKTKDIIDNITLTKSQKKIKQLISDYARKLILLKKLRKMTIHVVKKLYNKKIVIRDRITIILLGELQQANRRYLESRRYQVAPAA